uniref:beta-ketoacyl synthase N-terminal-like domain-containing protein n=1 Tax=Streptomyces sp. DG1A-41 TaxID=3125779 RepID=UPI00403FDDC4
MYTPASSSPERLRTNPSRSSEPACRFPGAVRSLTSLWRLLTARRDTVREVPGERWEQVELAGFPTRSRPGCATAASSTTSTPTSRSSPGSTRRKRPFDP